LLNPNLGGQIGWLIVLAIIGLIVAWGGTRFWTMSRARTALVLWGGWLITMSIFFSVAGFYHRYYLTTLSPAIAALVGIGIVALWRNHQAGGVRILLLPAALAVTAVVQAHILGTYPVWRDRLMPSIGILTGVAIIGLLGRSVIAFSPWIPRVLVSLGLAAVILTPATWSFITVRDATAGASMPLAGPEGDAYGLGNFGGGRFGGGGANRISSATGDDSSSSSAVDPELAYLIANKGTAKWIVAVASSSDGDQIILETGEAVMSVGGFDGADDILSVDAFNALVAKGEIRFYLGGGFGGFGRGGSSSAISSWVEETCRVVPESTIEAGAVSPDPATTTPGTSRIVDQFGGSTLYDCGGAATSSEN
ncbi:MAG TPA: hypothetical protein VFQ54_11175, partial [Thermomicrobiales bacterium]|nr:hypothetical protein [Thermomicrobiales bacterium]